MELLTQRLASLLTVKSLVTVILTAVFAAMAGTGRVTAEQFLTVFTLKHPLRRFTLSCFFYFNRLLFCFSRFWLLFFL